MLNSMRNALPALALLLLLGGPVKAACPEGDLFADCQINSLDLKVMADLWLDPPGSPADLVGGDGVGFADFAVLAANWGAVGEFTGSLVVTISPPEVILDGAQWRVDEGAWQESGDIQSLSVGFHTLEFAEIAGWTKPDTETVHVREGETTAISRTYVLPTGSLYVRISPQAAIDLGAKWHITGGAWQSSDQTLPDLPVGPYTIEFKPIDTWAEPPDQNVEVVEYLITDVRASYKHPLVINEFLASNSNFILDPQGEDDDWIEIYNSGDHAIDIGGMHLTDELDDPARWRIPDNIPDLTTIGAGDYLLIWADNDLDDNGTVQSGLHAGFDLSAAGRDEIGLFDTNGTSLIDSVEFPDQDPNISYGRYPDANDTWRFFSAPTPGSVNLGGYPGEVADTKFSHNRGFYDTLFSVTIACETQDANIYYTLDGTEPGKIDGPSYTGVPYTGAIPINKTSCLRAKAVKAGWKPSNADAQTYIFLDHVIAQPANPTGFPSYWSATAADYEMDPTIVNDSRYTDRMKSSLLSLPTMSIVTDVGHLFDSATGIYANPSNRGVAWEKPASVEFFDPAGGEEFQINCGLRIQGGWFRPLNNCRKKSFRLLFKGIYGSTKLEFPLFGKNAVDSFDTITLRGGANDGYAWSAAKYTEQYTRDEFARSLQSATGHAASRGNFVHLYVNGLYWGLYNPCERPDNSFSASHYGGEKENWDSIKTGKEVLNGSISTWNQMVAKCQQAASSDEACQELQGNNPDGTPNPAYPHLLDVPNYIDYLIVNVWAGNWDWPWKNYYMARQQGPESTGFKFFCWDCENTVGNNLGRSDLNKNALNNTFTHVGEPHTYLKQNAEYRMQFADHIHRLLFNGGILTPASLIARYSQMADQVELSIISESARWGDQHHHPPLTLEDWYDRDGNYSDGRAGRGWILDYYLPRRTDVVLDQFRSASLYPNIDAPVFRINGSYQHGGHISSTDSFFIAPADGTIYYTIDGNDPRMPVISQGGTTTKLVAEDAEKRVWVPTSDIFDTTWTNIGFNHDSWSDGTPVVQGRTGGVGYDERTTYRPYITYDVMSQMNNRHATCYIRISFELEGSPADFDTLTLRVRYDDAFVAYINGDLAERRNYYDEPTWNSNTPYSHSDSAAVNFEDIDISDHIGDLRSGDNILAIHGINNGTGSSDFLISVELIAGKSGIPTGGDISPSAIEYTDERTFTKSTHVKARLKNGSTWSALNEATYAIGPVAQSLRITEIMYHPQFTGDANDPNEEFIELKNIGGEKINLNLVKFTNGIDFTFGDLELGAGEYVLVVKNRAAFDAQYPSFSGLIAGEYNGSLNNAGERIELEDAVGQTILDFRYNDGWRRITDGGGFSLTIIDPSDSMPGRPDEGLVAHWALDDGSGTLAIDSAGTNNGTLNDDPTWTPGRIGGALTFDGSGDYVSFSSIGALTGNNLTADAWIRVTGLTGIWNPILTQHNPNNDGYYLYVYEDKPAFSVVGSGGTAVAGSPQVINWGQWYHVAGTNDGSNLRIYIDGHLKDSGPSAGLTGVDYAAYIGYDYASAAYYTGQIDDVRIYNRALSEEEFQSPTNLVERWNEKDSWRASAYVGGSPGSDDSGIIPNPGAIVINELLAHSPGTPGNWIELYNTTDAQIDIGGWYLSDTEFNLKKYRFADGTKIDAGEYLVLYENTHFGESSSDPGRITAFAFSDTGGKAYLTSAEAGVLTGYRAVEDFGASETDVSFGRYFKRSTGNYNFVSMSVATPRLPNAYPKVGPIVINEIMYHPDWPAGGSYENDRYEYIELRNISPAPVKLYDDNKGLAWEFTDGIQFTFPDWPNEVTIPAGGYLLVVKDVNAFTWRYPTVPAEKIVGPYDGQLSNSGLSGSGEDERVELRMPGNTDNFGRRHYIVIDRVNYSDGSHPDSCPGGVDLWPTEPDGGGKSLIRTIPANYGNDPNNWTAAVPSPGE